MEYEKLIPSYMCAIKCWPSIAEEVTKFENSDCFDLLTVSRALGLMSLESEKKVDESQSQERIQPGSDCSKFFPEIVSIANDCIKFALDSTIGGISPEADDLATSPYKKFSLKQAVDKISGGLHSSLSEYLKWAFDNEHKKFLAGERGPTDLVGHLETCAKNYMKLYD